MLRHCMLKSRLVFQRRFDAPIEAVFAALTDHEGMSDWPGLKRVRLIREGQPRNGLGAIRQVEVMGLRLDEEVVRWEPPRAFDYRIIKGLPVEHLGTVELVDHGSFTELTWRVRLFSWVPFLASLVLARLRAGLPIALAHVARTLGS